MQTNLYPKGPSNVPSNLASPGKSFKKHIWIASAALLLFMGLYLGLCGWSLYKAWRLFSGLANGGRGGFGAVVAALFLTFLGVFMLKALFFRNRTKIENAVEITKEEEPALFEFVNRVADEAKAPRPHKIFLSNTVNACVFYDLSVLNLIFPTRKNLEIGLGLVNTLDIGEFKSIIAHEFGHFAQKSMIIGRWVYVAHRIAYQIVAKRDGFDTFIGTISSLDLRIAWIGWILSILVWSIRSVSDTLFTIVLLTQRALSREMEFHADMVAVSLTGSDAIVNSLYKLQAADDAYENALEFAGVQMKSKKSVNDIYTIQSNYIRHMAVVLNNPAYGLSPKIPQGQGSSFRVFKDQIAHPPKMWSTHPSNTDREKNAKTVYIRSEADERSPWLLFKDAEKTRIRLTQNLYTSQKTKPEPLTEEQSIELHEKEFRRSYLLPKYRGIYLNRQMMINYREVNDIYTIPISEMELDRQLADLYPESLQKHLAALRNLEEEVAMLNGLNNKTLNAKEGKIIFRDRRISRKELPVVIGATQRELNAEQLILNEHDKLCRNVHYAAAKKIGRGWDEYLVSVTTIVHYCEHSQRHIEAMAKTFYETLAIVSKMRNLSHSDMVPLLNAANSLQYAIESIFTKGIEIKLSQPILDKMGGKSLGDYLEPFKLGKADANNINSWIGVVDGWMGLALRALGKLHAAALDELITSEEQVKAAYFSAGELMPYAPGSMTIYSVYARYKEGQGPVITQKADMFSRFYHADGTAYTIGRLVVAASIIGFGIFLTTNIGNMKIVLYNGLPIDAYVTLNGKGVRVAEHGSYEMELDNTSSIDVHTVTEEGALIESFTADIHYESQTYIYNVANAGVLYRWAARYGSAYNFGPDMDYIPLGAKRWFEVDADHYFEDPPETVQVSAGGSATRTVVSAYLGHPSLLLEAIENEKEKALFMTSHARYEKSDSPYILAWMNLASGFPNFKDILEERLAKTPEDIMLLRLQQDNCTKEEKAKLCAKQQQLAKEHPENANLYYLACRCLEQGKEQDSTFFAGQQNWKDNPWLAYGAGVSYCQLEEWDKAIACYRIVTEKVPALKELFLEDMKRICHFRKKDSLMVTSSDVITPYLQFVELTERSTNNTFETAADDYTYAYKLLDQGKLKEALEYCRQDSIRYNSILRLAAVSDSATEEIVEEAWKLNPSSSFNKATFIPAIALAIRKNQLASYKEPMQQLISEEMRDTIFRFIKYVQAKEIHKADNMLGSLTTELKGKLALLGVLIGEKNAPAKWREYATGLLFLPERPYLVNETRKVKKRT